MEDVSSDGVRHGFLEVYANDSVNGGYKMV